MTEKPSVRLIEILDNLKDVLSVGDFQEDFFREYVEKQFKDIYFGDYELSAQQIKKMILESSSTKESEVKTVKSLLNILRPFVK